MFANHQPIISAFARTSAENFAKVAVFTICTIRMPLREAAADFPAAWHGIACRSVFGDKARGIAEIKAFANDYHSQCEDAFKRSDCAADEIVLTLCHIPSIGPAKAGFIAQMVYGLSGCLDSHNLARFGIHPRTYQTGHIRTDMRRIPEYNALCERLGGTAYLWDSWCQYVADRGTAGTNDAEAISALHLAPIRPGGTYAYQASHV